MRIDRSNGADIVATISMEDCEYVFSTQDEDGIADFLFEKVGERESEISGVPVFMDASSWCTVACVGDVFIDDEFEISIDEAW